MSNSITASMMLVNGTIGEEERSTFKLIPVTKDCPYNEMIYDSKLDALIILGKEKKSYVQQLQKSEKVIIEKYYEYFITTYNEIVNFVNMFAQNHDQFDFKGYMN